MERQSKKLTNLESFSAADKIMLMKCLLMIFVSFLFCLNAFPQLGMPCLMRIEHYGSTSDKVIYTIIVIDSLKMDLIKTVKYNKESTTVIPASSQTLSNLYKPTRSLSYPNTIDTLKIYEFGTFLFQFIFESEQRQFLRNRKESVQLLHQMEAQLSPDIASENKIRGELRIDLRRIEF